MIRASIDIGSNSVLLLCAEVDEKSLKISQEIFNDSFITSLGKDLDKNKVFCEESMSLTFDALKNFKNKCDSIRFNTSDVIVTATEASRVALNANMLFEKVKTELGFKVQVINGKGEAYYTALGVVSNLTAKMGSVVVMDIGGASTELIKINLSPFEIVDSISLPVGSVRATDWRNAGEFETRMENLLSKDLRRFETKELICVAGSMTSLATMFKGQQEFSDKMIEGLNISFQAFLEFSHDLQKTNVENLLLLFPFLGKRAPMVAAGSLVAEMFGKVLKIEKMIISTRGLRFGTLLTGGIDEQFKF
jgi:exopolyphosphatase/guanosine-5'-triphosphate,3'-diphosphate pyrophosphatase